MSLLEQTKPAAPVSRVLSTPRLELRSPRRDEAAPIAALANDRRIAESTLGIPHPYPLAEAQRCLGAGDDGEALFVVTRQGAIIGCCGVARREREQPEIGCWLGVAYWGKGYATEAARAVIDYAFGELGCEVLHGGARVSSPASRRVLEKCGFQWTGVGLYRIRALATSAPVDRFRLDRRLWASLKAWGRLADA